MEILTVALGERSYPIYIGQNLLNDSRLIQKHIPDSSVMVVSNEAVAHLYSSTLISKLEIQRLDRMLLPDGEQYKTLDTVNSIYTSLLKSRHDRKTTLLALGGGVVGDITGFTAATYLRGVNFIQVPTTLLAQVDSSVGGKTGVNHPLGKNMIGAFYQPRCVVIDTATLNTLDDRQLSAGLAEVIKYGLIGDYEFFTWLERHIEDILERDPQTLTHAIRRSCENKASVVAADEREQSGHRALLNLGHTFGHAIETGMGYGTWLHGEAVSVGMVMAAEMSLRLGWLKGEDVARIRRILERARLPTVPPKQMSSDQFMELMSVDKKVVGGMLRLVLMRSIGDAVVTSDFDTSILEATLSSYDAA